MLKKIASILIAITSMAFAAGSIAAAVTPAETAKVIARVQQLSPGVKVDSVSKVDQSDLYEVVVGRNVIYVDGSMRYVMEGNLVDIDKKANLTEARVEQLNRIDFSTLPTRDAIVTVKGNGKRKLAVFSDPDCPYCKRLENELAALNNVTIYTYLFPIVSLHPNAYTRSVSVWCAPNKAKAWDIAMKGGELAPAKCTTPVDRTVELGQKLGINGTPTLVFASGKRVPGAIPAAQIESLLN
ncbi:DsbC family protein [Undibacterium sp.]|uniref:DsbC family protein n=1 Tax=Undibacterium sp. TaxID=1914977 RepID=UPI00374D647B